jgi:uncharacterized membrane-anchored protein YhcB (DUF1043 family)
MTIALITPEWLGTIETLAFVGLLIGIIYNRLVNWRGFSDRTKKLESQFEQYQKDVSMFFLSCQSCKKEISEHHEAAELHVTRSMMSQIDALVTDVAAIKTFLMNETRR